MSRLLIAGMILFVNISEKPISHMTFIVAHWDSSDDSFAF